MKLGQQIQSGHHHVYDGVDHGTRKSELAAFRRITRRPQDKSHPFANVVREIVDQELRVLERPPGTIVQRVGRSLRNNFQLP